MAGQKFQYDESGGTFYYFVLSFLALLLLPGTYYWWPRAAKFDEEEKERCLCESCKKKKIAMSKSQPWKTVQDLTIKLLIVSGWCMLLFLTYKVSQFDYEYANFDPYEILGIPVGCNDATIKKAYRRLSLILHPDKETGNEKAFMKLTKAYQALTDEESRRNWERYGNPDGPGAMSFGIALPSWIVEKENSFWVLGLYALVFMVALPTVVGMWWYKSIKYSSDKVLLDTTRMFYYFFHKTPSMPIKRVIMILSAALEFDGKYNSEMKERESDSVEMPKLISQLTQLGEKNKERPLYYKYAVKARALIHAHLSRLPLPPKTLDVDRINITTLCPHLVQEMVNCIAQLVMLAYAQRVPRLLHIDTLENCMKVSPMIVQALWEFKSPLLQLPHIQEDHLRHFVIQKRPIRNVQQFARLKYEDKRNVLKFLKEEQFRDVMTVMGKMPHVEFQVRCEVIDDEATTVYTAGAIITVTVTLIRKNLSAIFGEDAPPQPEPKIHQPKKTADDEAEYSASKVTDATQNKVLPNGIKPKCKKNKKKQTLSAAAKKKLKWERKQKMAALAENEAKNESSSDEDSDSSCESTSSAEIRRKADKETARANEELDRANATTTSETKGGDDDDDDWDKFQTGIDKKDRSLEGRSKQSHPVHCPYFIQDKQEYWWVYVSDRKSRTLLTTPCQVTELVDQHQFQIRFTAPRWPGVYTFAVCLRSDSYFGFDQMKDIKLDVKEAPEVQLDHPQWEMSDEDDEENSGAARSGNKDDSELSEFTTDEDVEED